MCFAEGKKQIAADSFSFPLLLGEHSSSIPKIEIGVESCGRIVLFHLGTDRKCYTQRWHHGIDDTHTCR